MRNGSEANLNRKINNSGLIGEDNFQNSNSSRIYVKKDASYGMNSNTDLQSLDVLYQYRGNNKRAIPLQKQNAINQDI